jgi:hypothetical protein
MSASSYPRVTTREHLQRIFIKLNILQYFSREPVGFFKIWVQFKHNTRKFSPKTIPRCVSAHISKVSPILIKHLSERKMYTIEQGKGLPQQAEVAQWVPGRLRPRIFLTFGTTRVVGRQPYDRPPLPQEKSLVLIFRGWVDPRAHGSVGRHGKIPSNTTGSRFRDRPTSSAVP